MPELPEVETTCRGLAPHLVGRRIVAVAVRDSRLRWPVAKDLAAAVTGQRIIDLRRRAKYLIIELELDDVSIFLVHLSLKYRHRHIQLRRLYELVKRSSKPVIVAGDFNTFWGKDETFLFREALQLRSANVSGLPSFPSKAPRLELDFILYGPGIEVSDFRVPQVIHSDHLPLICDFEVDR